MALPRQETEIERHHRENMNDTMRDNQRVFGAKVPSARKYSEATGLYLIDTSFMTEANRNEVLTDKNELPPGITSHAQFEHNLSYEDQQQWKARIWHKRTFKKPFKDYGSW
jgi:hypothetical protein